MARINNPTDVSQIQTDTTAIVADSAAILIDTAAMQPIVAVLPNAGALTDALPRRLAATKVVLTPSQPEDGTGVVSGSSNVYGAFVQFIASAPADLLLLGVYMSLGNQSNNIDYSTIGIAIGAAGSEVLQIEWPGAVRAVGEGDAQWVPFPVPLPIASGSRVALQVADDIAAGTYQMTLVHIREGDYEAWNA
jgi:hypothetical protein